MYTIPVIDFSIGRIFYFDSFLRESLIPTIVSRKTSNEFHTICTRFKRLTIRNALKPNRKYSFRGWERDTNVNHSLYIYESLIIAQANIWTEAKVVYYRPTVFNSAGGDYSYEF